MYSAHLSMNPAQFQLPAPLSDIAPEWVESGDALVHTRQYMIGFEITVTVQQCSHLIWLACHQSCSAFCRGQCCVSRCKGEHVG